MFPAKEKRFIKTNFIAIIVLFLVIIAGGVVRSTGSGMGCPDWPRCFNRIVPPTDISQLPSDYAQHYVDGRVKKNERFARVLDKLGYKEEAYLLRHDKSILQHEPFNAAKTWTEYVNRLVGVVSGIFLLLTAIYSITYLKTKSSIFFLSILNLFVVVFQAWLGSIVVSTNLTPWVITIHMLLAIVIVCISIYTYFKAVTLRDKSSLINQYNYSFKLLAIVSLFIMLVQIVVGTGVREEVDRLNGTNTLRQDFIQTIGTQFEIHRLVSYCSLILVIILFFLIRSRFNVKTIQSKFAWITLILVGIQMMSGIILARFAIPAFAQTTHLVVATLLFGAQYYLMLVLSKQRR